MTAHTPGPWTVSICGKRDEVVTVVADGVPVASVDATRSVSEAHANAAVLAAALDLLDAAREILDRHRVCGSNLGGAVEEHGSYAEGYFEGIGQAADLLVASVRKAVRS